MLDNLTLVAGLIIVFWLGVLAAYVVITRQQKDLQKDIEELQQLMDKTEKQN